jgi:hypothetical protein
MSVSAWWKVEQAEGAPVRTGPELMRAALPL